MFDTNTFILSFIFGTIGLGYFIYGKKDGNALFLLLGIILMTYTYFVKNLYLGVGIGTVLSIIPLFIK